MDPSLLLKSSKNLDPLVAVLPTTPGVILSAGCLLLLLETVLALISFILFLVTSDLGEAKLDILLDLMSTCESSST